MLRALQLGRGPLLRFLELLLLRLICGVFNIGLFVDKGPRSVAVFAHRHIQANDQTIRHRSAGIRTDVHTGVAGVFLQVVLR